MWTLDYYKKLAAGSAPASGGAIGDLKNWAIVRVWCFTGVFYLGPPWRHTR
jgi:hypothetical protein